MPSRDDKPKSTGNDNIDFGAFVESNVQRTSDLLKGEPTSTARGDGDRTIERARDGSYWRKRAADVGVPTELDDDELPPATTTRTRKNRYLADDSDAFHDANEFGNGGGGGFSDTVNHLFNGDDGGRNRIIAAILALLLVVLIIWGLLNLFGGDGKGDGGDVTPTPTGTIIAPTTPTPIPTQPPVETPEPTIPRGGDNQRGEGHEVQTPQATIQITNEVARACSGQCLIRAEGDNQEDAYTDASARASWADGDLSWVVVTPEQAQILSESLTLTLIENNPVTYNLYAVESAEDHNQESVVSPHGEIIDQTGRYYLVRWNQVPAIVKEVTDWGYAVYKLAPAQPTYVSTLGTNGAASDTTGWQLLEEVNQDNIEDVTNDLVHMGELDNSGWGTRYYTYPGNQIAADYLYQELESYGLTVWYEDFITWDGYLLVNVVGEIPGSDDSKIYAMMAHLDTINLENSRIAPGADDNASGIAVTLEITRILASYDLTHPVRVVFVNAEEVGILGSDAWARQVAREGTPIAGVYNIDSVASVRNRPTLMTNATGTSTSLQTLMTQVNNEYGLGENLIHYQSSTIVADDNMLREQGIPAVMIARELYQQSEFHHTANDTPANFSLGAIADTAKIILVCMWTLVM
ncbi:MAG: Zn-dependent exopeptidase M28 [Thermomicrobiales bacterium]|nr:Zn-dependent exopeptidase M28 [Thermomicrobiales bacterium]